jgi:mannose/fructose/N-acetylgalactosamine-specific phosphotransferase system component IIB
LNWGLIRIDDRLIHGQVIAVWCKTKKFTRIAIIDDMVAADSFMQQVLKLAAPAGIQVEAFSVADGIKVLAQVQSPETTMVLMKTPLTAKRLFEGGFNYTELNIGGIGGGPGRKNVFKNTALSDEEFGILKDLTAKGVKITFLSVPGEKSKEFTELMNERK